jgi:hypothetical protein
LTQKNKFIYFFYFSLTHESIPYLAKKKRYDEIFQVLNSIAKSNKTQLDETAWKSFLIKVLKKKQLIYIMNNLK